MNVSESEMRETIKRAWKEHDEAKAIGWTAQADYCEVVAMTLEWVLGENDHPLEA